MSNSNEDNKRPIYMSLWFWAAVVFVGWLLSLIANFVFFGASDSGATFGDSFGAINALFTGLAFAGVIVTANMQRQELKMQREELALTRNELAASAEAQKGSEKALQFQVELMAKQALLDSYHAGYKANMDIRDHPRSATNYDARKDAEEKCMFYLNKMQALETEIENSLKI